MIPNVVARVSYWWARNWNEPKTDWTGHPVQQTAPASQPVSQPGGRELLGFYKGTSNTLHSPWIDTISFKCD